jgi:rod shape-determining protein MreD
MGAFVVSKTIVGFLAGTTGVLELDPSPSLAFLATAVLTLIARIGWMFLSPHGSIASFLLATMTVAVYNGVIAVPIYALLKRVLDPGGW